jgi:outer membrane protein assembly factor BamB
MAGRYRVALGSVISDARLPAQYDGEMVALDADTGQPVAGAETMYIADDPAIPGNKVFAIGREANGKPSFVFSRDSTNKPRIIIGQYTMIGPETQAQKVLTSQLIITSGSSIFCVADDGQTWIHVQFNRSGQMISRPATPVEVSKNKLSGVERSA